MSAPGPSTGSRPRVVIVGGGVAALEAVLALHDLAPGRVDVTLLAPEDEFSLRPMSVAVPFDHGPVGTVALADVMAAHGGTFVQGAARAVDAAARIVRCPGGPDLPYDALLLAPGARTRPALPSGITFDAHAPGAVAAVAQAAALGWARTIAFVVPPGITWPVPLYELALMTAAQLGPQEDVALHLVTPEPRPLAVFGAAASAVLAQRLRDAPVAFHGGVRAHLVGDRELEIGAIMPLRADRIVALGVMDGPALDGVPHDEGGFIPVDDRGRVAGLPDVWAAGDGTDHPIKQGGLACQQADAIAAQLAAWAGADVTFRPAPAVLRAQLFTGTEDLFLRRTVGEEDGEAATTPPWDPPAKVVGRYLGPYLAEHGIASEREGPGGPAVP